MRTRMKHALAGLTTAGFLALATPASANSATLYSPDPLDGWGHDGTAYAVAIVRSNSVVYAGGTSRTPPLRGAAAAGEPDGGGGDHRGPDPDVHRQPHPEPVLQRVDRRGREGDGHRWCQPLHRWRLHGRQRSARNRIARLDLAGNLLP